MDTSNKDSSKATEIDPNASNRVWQHAIHEEVMFNETGNFFLIAEAMLLVFYATLADNNVRMWALMVITVLGFCLTAMWLAINKRQVADLEEASKRIGKYCPEFTEFESARNERDDFRDARFLLSWGVPIIIILTGVSY